MGPRFLKRPDHERSRVIVDVATGRSNKAAEVGAMQKMRDRTEDRFDPAASRMVFLQGSLTSQ